jgi:hypothetical protein
MRKGYDIIGDIHGCAISLQCLLEKLGYQLQDGVYQHNKRQVIFLGDFIDRGPYQQEVIDLVRPMVESGNAYAVMGNHEFNAIAWHTYDTDRNDYMRPHSTTRQRQHQAFLDAFQEYPDELKSTIEWFKTLPLWLDFENIRVVHACWDYEAMSRIQALLTDKNCLTSDFLSIATTYGSQQFKDVETLLKGKEILLPQGQKILDKDGHEWTNIRIRWWDQTARTYHSAFLGKPSDISHIPDKEFSGDYSLDYSQSMPPVFLGHYWMDGTPTPLAENIACVDYSVAKPEGKLVAYRWDGEQKLSTNKFELVEREELN